MSTRTAPRASKAVDSHATRRHRALWNRVRSGLSLGRATLLDTAGVIRRNIRTLLVAREENDGWLAARMGLHAATLSRKLNGKISWTIEEIEEAAGILGVSPGRLLEGWL